MIWTAAFWKGAAERAIKTFFQVFAAYLGLSAGTELVPGIGVEGAPWVSAVSLATVSAILSIATSIGNADFTAGPPPAYVEPWTPEGDPKHD